MSFLNRLLAFYLSLLSLVILISIKFLLRFLNLSHNVKFLKEYICFQLGDFFMFILLEYISAFVWLRSFQCDLWSKVVRSCSTWSCHLRKLRGYWLLQLLKPLSLQLLLYCLIRRRSLTCLSLSLLIVHKSSLSYLNSFRVHCLSSHLWLEVSFKSLPSLKLSLKHVQN